MAEAKTVVTDTITYLPGPGDPAAVKWGGHTFHANVPKDIKGDPEGTERDRLNHQLIESAKFNPVFRIGSEKGPRRQKGQQLPKTADEYKRYFVGWLTDGNLDSAAAMIERFAKDRELQATCEVGTDDYSFIRDLFMPRLSDLAKADELGNEQVAALWLNHGYNQLPW